MSILSSNNTNLVLNAIFLERRGYYWGHRECSAHRQMNPSHISNYLVTIYSKEPIEYRSDKELSLYGWDTRGGGHAVPIHTIEQLTEWEEISKSVYSPYEYPIF